jgi:hypothetical protein
MIKTSALKLVTPHRRVVPRSNDRRLPHRRVLSLAGAYPTRPIRFDFLGELATFRSGKDKSV